MVRWNQLLRACSITIFVSHWNFQSTSVKQRTFFEEVIQSISPLRACIIAEASAQIFNQLVHGIGVLASHSQPPGGWFVRAFLGKIAQ